MPHVDNAGLKIGYCVEGEGLPLVLLHGFTDSAESWYELGYVHALQANCHGVELNEPAAGAISSPAVMLSLSRCARNRTVGRLSRDGLAALLLMDVLNAPFSRTFNASS